MQYYVVVHKASCSMQDYVVVREASRVMLHFVVVPKALTTFVTRHIVVAKLCRRKAAGLTHRPIMYTCL
jgi:hypothetical protein